MVAADSQAATQQEGIHEREVTAQGSRCICPLTVFRGVGGRRSFLPLCSRLPLLGRDPPLTRTLECGRASNM